MIRLLGVFLTVLVLYAVLMLDERARTTYHLVLAGRLGFYGILTLGVGVLIVSGGIDLSIGSVVGLCAVLYGLLLEGGVSAGPAALLIVAVGGAIGLIHGLLVTRLKLQPFLVTLCGLFIYRGLARWMSKQAPGFGASDAPALKGWLLGGEGLAGSHQLILLGVLAAALGLLLHFTRFGRYLFAIGANEDAAKYAGIATQRYKVLAYVICSTLAALGGVLLLLDVETVNPTQGGSLLELYAITGAVLGGCSLRGGEGGVPGMILGAAVLPLLRGISSFNKVPSDVEYAVIGSALLLGTIADELLKGRGRG
ncbi:MAG: ABC transporter permease [Gemmataceae bacterium]